MTTVTFDTNLWIDLRDNRGSHEALEALAQILEWHRRGLLEVVSSNRLKEPDSAYMSKKGKEEIEELLREHKIKIMPAPFRTEVSTLAGLDVLEGCETKRTKEEFAKFDEICGGDPASRKSKCTSNDIGDYDTLRGHFAFGFDVLLTNDCKRIFSIDKRERYNSELGILIQNPEEFVKDFSRQSN